MKYYVTEITTVNGTEAKAIWDHSTFRSAKAQYHQILASAYANADLTYALVKITNDIGFDEITERIPEYVEE